MKKLKFHNNNTTQTYIYTTTTTKRIKTSAAISAAVKCKKSVILYDTEY
jgi:hypothetical protein